MSNPLLRSEHPQRLPDFSGIRPEHVVPALWTLIEGYRTGVMDWARADFEPDWSTVDAEVEWADALARAWSPVSHLNSVADNESLRKAYNEGLELLTEHENWRQQHPDVYRVYRALRDSTGFARLSPVQQRIVHLRK